jgi:hypothetical protein
VDFQRPFDILLKFKALKNDTDGKKVKQKKGRTSKIPERTIQSGFMNEVRTYFEQKLANQGNELLGS